MKIWICSREYAGIAEAGGVKNVTRSLAEGFSRENCTVTVFMPVYASSIFCEVEISGETLESSIKIGEKFESVKFSFGKIQDVQFVFVHNEIFSKKFGIYTYTKDDEALNPKNISGVGHNDFLLEDVIFQKAVVAYALLLCKKNDFPDVVHCQDATAALIPVFAHFPESVFAENPKNLFLKTAFFVTIHNAGKDYRHAFENLLEAKNLTNLEQNEIDQAVFSFRFEPFLAASKYAFLTTVSENYALELLDCEKNPDFLDGISFEFARRKIKIEGITNGIEFSRYDPCDKKKSLLPFEFNPETLDLTGKNLCRIFFLKNYAKNFLSDETSLKNENSFENALKKVANENIFLCFQGRLVRQKGLEVFLDAIPSLFEKIQNLKILIAGHGEKIFEEWAQNLSLQFPKKMFFSCGYNRKLSRLIISASDFMILPSIFEPCCLEDLIAQIYATIPIAHATGGLKKIDDGKTGFLYSPNNSCEILKITENAIRLKNENPEQIQKMIQNSAKIIKQKFSWKKIINEKYLPLFKNALENFSAL